MPKSQDPNVVFKAITEENQKLYTYIGQLHRALSNAMDTIGNTFDNGENCPYCGNDYNFEDVHLVFNCVNPDCEGNEAQKVLNEVNKACGEAIKAFGQERLNIR